MPMFPVEKWSFIYTPMHNIVHPCQILGGYIKSPVFHDTENGKISQNLGRKQNSQHFTENTIIKPKNFNYKKYSEIMKIKANSN